MRRRSGEGGGWVFHPVRVCEKRDDGYWGGGLEVCGQDGEGSFICGRFQLGGRKGLRIPWSWVRSWGRLEMAFGGCGWVAVWSSSSIVSQRSGPEQYSQGGCDMTSREPPPTFPSAIREILPFRFGVWRVSWGWGPIFYFLFRVVS